ncbi:hypothetical protein ACF065_18350 [Streptomyces sp. NPDC015232]|uniref:hypothetical protein n=1 Tax=unclassified Streptomyces TaxID=2593676 RepID=UPI0036F9D6EE
MTTKRRAATVLALLGLLQTALGIVFTPAVSKDFGAPLFWSSTFSLGLAWFAERQASRL